MIRKLFSTLNESNRSFEGKETGENVLLLLRRHRFILYIPLSIFVFAAIVPIVAYFYLSENIAEAKMLELFFFASSLWYMFFWIATFYSVTLYTLNTVIITDRRIVDNDQHSLFNRQVSELHIHRVQDVSVHTNGVIETFLGFGDIHVQTAGSEKQFIFHQIANPEIVKDKIMRILSMQRSGIKPVNN